MFDFRKSLLASGLGVSVFVSGAAHAASASLSSLLSGGTFNSGGLVFSDFTFTPGPDFSTPATEIDISDVDGGILIQIPTLVSGSAIADAALSFNVSSDEAINSVQLRSVGDTFNGAGNIAIAETVETADGVTLATLGNLIGVNGDITNETAAIAGSTFLSISKDIALFPSGDSAFISDVFQVFGTTATAVPTPTAVLAGLFGLGFVAGRRRRVQA